MDEFTELQWMFEIADRNKHARSCAASHLVTRQASDLRNMLGGYLMSRLTSFRNLQAACKVVVALTTASLIKIFVF